MAFSLLASSFWLLRPRFHVQDMSSTEVMNGSSLRPPARRRACGRAGPVAPGSRPALGRSPPGRHGSAGGENRGWPAFAARVTVPAKAPTHEDLRPPLGALADDRARSGTPERPPPTAGR